MPFTHPAVLPVPVALAVHAIAHNQALPEHWERLDAYVRRHGMDRTLDLVVQTLEMNGVPITRLDDERAWWAKELRKVQ